MVICYDTETATYSDGVDASKNRLKVFAYYNTETGESAILRETDRDKIKEVLSNHEVKVGFNNKAYDDMILRREGYQINGLILDLREIIKKKSPVMRVKFKSYSLKNICSVLGLNAKSDDMNYEWLNNDSLIEEHWQEIKEYTLQDIKITTELWEYVNEYFAAFADPELISAHDAKQYKHLTMSSGSYAYKVICRKAGLTEDYNDNAEYEHYDGGYFSQPEKELTTGNIYCLDFNCLHGDTDVITKNGYKKISDCKEGDVIKTINGWDTIINFKKKRKKQISRVKLQTTEIKGTPEHRILTEHEGKITPRTILELKKGDKIICLKKDINHGIKGENVKKFLNLQKPEPVTKTRTGKEVKKREVAQCVKQNTIDTNHYLTNIVQKNARIKEEGLTIGVQNLLKKKKENLEKKLDKVNYKEENQLSEKKENTKTQNIDIGETMCLKEINTPVDNVKNEEVIYKLTTNKNGIKTKNYDTMLIMEKHYVLNATENTINKTAITEDTAENQQDIYEIQKIKDILIEEHNDYVYDIMMKNQRSPYFIANGVVSHNSAYPHSYIQANLFSNKCNCCREEEKYAGGALFKLKGRYCVKKQGKIETTIQWLYNKRKELKKAGDKREYAYKIILNTIYGICGNAVFKNVYNTNTASDCTHVARTMIKLAKKRYTEAGYEFIYTATDSVYLKDPYNDEQKLLRVKDEIIKEIKNSFLYPVSTFDMGIDDRIKLIYFPGLKKSNYMYVTRDGDIKIKGLPFWKDNSSPMSMHVFKKYIRQAMIENNVVKHPAENIRRWIQNELKTDAGLRLVSTEHKVKNHEEYKLSSQLQAQISKRYGKGIHELIPNNAGIGVGLTKNYCTITEFKNAGLNSGHVNLDKVYNELQIFSEEPLNNTVKTRRRKGKVVNNSLAEWIR